MFTRSRLAATLAAALGLLVLAACSTTSPAGPGYGSAPGSAPITSAPATSAPATSTPPGSSAPGGDTAGALAIADSSLGPILVDGKGMTLYLFATDSPGVSTCTGACLAKWPPLAGAPTAGNGVDDSRLGSFQRTDDGSTQATYNGWPLYSWVGDAAPGDVSGQGVGGNWWVLDRDGDPVKS